MKQRNGDETLAGLRATDDTGALGARGAEPIRTPVRMEARESGNGALWALCAALTLALIGFAYWSHQQQMQLQRQLVATQNSFARISEEAAGRIQDVSGKLSAAESSLSVAEQNRRERLAAIEKQLADLADKLTTQGRSLASAEATGQELASGLATQRETQQTLTTQTGELAELVAAQAERITSAETRAAENATQLADLVSRVTALREDLAQLDELERRLNAQTQTTTELNRRVEALAKAGAGAEIEQQLLVLRTEMEERQNYTQEALQSIDAFRRQVNRNIVTLKEQIANLQQQLARS